MLQTAAAVLGGYGRFQDDSAGLAAGVIAAVLSLLLLPFIIRSSSIGRRRLNIVVMIIASAALASAVFVRVRGLTDCRGFDPGNAPFRCEIRGVQERRYDTGLEVLVSPAEGAVKGGNARYNAIVHAPRGLDCRRGDRFELCARPRPADRAAIADSPYLRDMARRGIRCVFYAKDRDITFTYRAGWGLRDRLRRDIESRISALFPPGHAALLRALYFGNSSPVEKGTINDYRRAGVLHILAASGFNIAIVAAMPLILLAPLRVHKKAILLVCALFATVYLCLTDMPVSLLRAFVMFAVCAIERLIDGDRNAMNALLIAAAALLLICPAELYSLGFQLSFGATAGIIMLQRPYRAVLRGIPGPLADSVALTLSAQAPVFPVIALTLGEVNLTGILSNLVMVPAISVVFVTGASAVLLDAVHPAAGHLLAKAVSWLTGACGTFSSVMASLGGHRSFSGTPLLLIPYVLYLVPAVSPHCRKIGPLLLAAAIAASLALLPGTGNRGERVAFMNSGKSRGALYACGGRAVYSGTLGDVDDAGKIVRFFQANSMDALDLHIASAGAGSLTPVIRLIRATTVRRCVIDPAACSGRKLSEFTGVIETDNIRLEVRPVAGAEGIAGMPAERAAEAMRPLLPDGDGRPGIGDTCRRAVHALFKRSTGIKKDPVEIVTL